MSFKKLILIISVVLIIFVIITQVSFFDFLTSGIKYSIGTISKPFYLLATEIGDRFARKSEILNENTNLHTQLSQITVDYAELEKLKLENNTLRNELDFLKTNDFDHLPAKVLSKGSINDASVYILNKGKQSGVEVGMPVIYDKGILVGKIIQTDSFTSQMLLATNQNSLISATVQNESQTVGLVKGEHNLSMRMDFIPQDQELELGNTIITSGEEQYIPYGIVIGQVISIDKEDNNFFQSTTISSPANLKNIQNVMIIKQ